MTRVRSARILLAAIAAIVSVFQPAAAQDGSVSGVVINAATGEPLEGSIVELYRVIGSSEDRSVDPYLTTAGGDGRFSFQNVQPGQYRLVSFRNDGFVGAEFGQRSFNSPAGTLTLRAGETFEDIRLALTPTASISGRVRDDDGEPLGKVRVQAMKRSYLGPAGEPESLMIVQAAYTNDFGQYRLFWLAPGQYVVSAIEEDPRDQPTPLFNAPNRANLGGAPSVPRLIRRMLDDGTVQEEVGVSTYFPNTQDEEAAAYLSVRAGEELGGIDVTHSCHQCRYPNQRTSPIKVCRTATSANWRG